MNSDMKNYYELEYPDIDLSERHYLLISESWHFQTYVLAVRYAKCKQELKTLIKEIVKEKIKSLFRR